MRAQTLKYLYTFHQAARNQSFVAAGDALCVTPSAVSHQIRSLEAQLGLALFERHGRGARLTEAGGVLFQHADAILGRIDAAARDLRLYQRRPRMRLQVPPFFSSELLLAILPELCAEHGDMTLEVSTPDRTLAEHGWDADVSVIVAHEAPPDLQSQLLFPQSFVPACSPELLHRAPLHSESDIVGRTLICHRSRPDLWDQWAAARGLEPLVAQHTLRCESMVGSALAAERSAGIAMISVPLGAGRFARGTLVQLSEVPLSTGDSYFLVVRAQDAESAGVAKLWHSMAEKFSRAPLCSR